MKYYYKLLFAFASCVFPHLLFGQAGILDSSFGINGKVITSIGSTSGAGDVTFMGDGKILVCGGYDYYPNSNGCVIRYNQDGSIDPSFGIAGIASNANTQNGTSIQIQADGKILSCGTNHYPPDLSSIWLTRYQSNGQPDLSFGTVYQPCGGYPSSVEAHSLIVQPDGKIIVTGNGQGYCPGFIVARYNIDGTPDSSFGDNSLGFAGLTHVLVGNSFDYTGCGAIQDDGKIVVGGGAFITYDSYFVLVRFNSNGLPDSTFGTNGIVIADPSPLYDQCTAIIIQPDGKILAVGLGNDNTHSDFVLGRFNSDGSVDSTFGNGGFVQTDIDSSHDIAFSAKLQIDGRIIVAGLAVIDTVGYFALARYDANGLPDTSFGNNGKVLTDFNSSENEARSVSIQPDGKIVAVGLSLFNGVYNMVMARYLSGLNVGLETEHHFTDYPRIFPNPAKTDFSLEYTLNSSQPVSLILQDMQGRVLKTFKQNDQQSLGKHQEQFSFPSKLASGMYFLNLETELGRITIKVMKQ